MDGDEDAIGGGICDCGTLLKGDEGVVRSGSSRRLQAFLPRGVFSGTEAHIEGEIFFVAEDADGAFVMAAMAGIQDDGIVTGIEAGDEFRAEAGLDGFCEIEA